MVLENSRLVFCKSMWSQQKHFFYWWSILSIISKDPCCLLPSLTKYQFQSFSNFLQLIFCEVTFRTNFYFETKQKQNGAYFTFFLFLHFAEFFKIIQRNVQHRHLKTQHRISVHISSMKKKGLWKCIFSQLHSARDIKNSIFATLQWLMDTN